MSAGSFAAEEVGESGIAPAASTRRPRVALLLDYMSFFDGAYQSRIAETFHGAAEKLGIELSMVIGRGLQEPNPVSKCHNAVFDLVDPRCADGVVLISTVLASHCGAAGVSTFIERYAGLPVVSVGVPLPGVPSVIVDNATAMQTIVEHLLVEHGKRRVAFVAGTRENPESEARLAGYRRALEQHGIAFDEALVGYGNFVHWAARATVTEILDRAGTIEALVAANDAMAFGAIDVLRGRGLGVPNDVAVTGFDDVWLGRLGSVALTTVSQPFESMAEQALELVRRRIAGVEVEPITQVSADMIVRRSCGCRVGTQLARAKATPAQPRSAAEHVRENGAHLTTLVQSALGGGRAPRFGHSESVFEALRAELEGRDGAFLAMLDNTLRECKGDHDAHQVLHNTIDALREEFRPFADRKLDDLWYRALSRIAHGTMAAGTAHRVRIDNEYLRLLSTADRVSVALDLETLRDAIVGSLTNVGIQAAFISCFAEDSDSELEPLVGMVDGVRVEAAEKRFRAAELVPPSLRPTDRRRTFAVFPLVFEARWLGVAAFEYVAGAQGYPMLRDQFAAALGHVLLHQQVLAKTMLHERSVQERQATTRRLEALSVLAGGVAHDLNNTLGPLVALPDIVMAELDRPAAEREAPEVIEGVRADMKTIKSAGLRAAQTIKDLLTLGRQGRTPKEPLDLNRVVTVELHDTFHVLAKEYPDVETAVELSRDSLLVRGSEAHLARALTNLVRNAAEAIKGSGRVVVKTGIVRLEHAVSRYETIPAGEYAVLSVSDTGGGIPAAELERVFEPFFSRKRVGERSGSGLGLAIVYGTAKEHDGFVDLASKVGSGTTFSLYLPRAEEQSRIASSRPAAPHGTARILVVDDDPLQGRIARRALSHLGYDVEVLSSGARALETVRRGGSPYDLVLLDITLNEELDGLELLERMREVRPQQKAVMVSGQAARYVAEGLARGATWLAKPYTAEDLGKAVETALDASEYAGLAARTHARKAI